MSGPHHDELVATVHELESAMEQSQTLDLGEAGNSAVDDVANQINEMRVSWARAMKARLTGTETLVGQLENHDALANGETAVDANGTPKRGDVLGRFRERQEMDKILLADVARMIEELASMAELSQSAIVEANDRLSEMEHQAEQMAAQQDADVAEWSDSVIDLRLAASSTEDLVIDLRSKLDQAEDDAKRVRAEVEEARERSTKAADEASRAADGVDGLRADIEAQIESEKLRKAEASADGDKLETIERTVAEVALESRARERRMADVAKRDIDLVRDRLDELETKLSGDDDGDADDVEIEEFTIRPPENWQFERRRGPDSGSNQ